MPSPLPTCYLQFAQRCNTLLSRKRLRQWTCAEGLTVSRKINLAYSKGGKKIKASHAKKSLTNQEACLHPNSAKGPDALLPRALTDVYFQAQNFGIVHKLQTLI